MTTPTSIQEQIQSLEPSAIIELFKLELTAAVNGINETFHYHAGTNSIYGDIKFDNITYTAIPIEVEGFEMSARGTLPRPTMRVANVLGTISALLITPNINPLQAKVTRIRTCKKFLDDQPNPDPTAKFPDEIYYIDRVSKEDIQMVEFELASKLDLTNLQLPGRQVTEYCPWRYRGTECGYVGATYFDINDNKTEVANDDVCAKRFVSCQKRFDSQGIKDYPHGGFPGARIQT